MIQVQDATRFYGSVRGYERLSLSVSEGELYGLIGPDGAGKTSLIRTLVSLLRPDCGTLRVMGFDPVTQSRKVRSAIGYMPQRFSLYQDLSVEQNLHFFAGLFGISRSERDERLRELYRFSRLEPFRKRRAGALSGGMKQKLALSCNLIHRPKLLVLDEPTFGVDPVSRAEFWSLLGEIRREGATILCSTPYMDEAERFDRITFLYQGQKIARGTPEEVVGTFPYPLYKVRARDIRALRRWFDRQPEVTATQLFGDDIHVAFRAQPDKPSSWKEKPPVELTLWEPLTPSIEDVFLWRIGGNNGS